MCILAAIITSYKTGNQKDQKQKILDDLKELICKSHKPKKSLNHRLNHPQKAAGKAKITLTNKIKARILKIKDSPKNNQNQPKI